MTPETKKGYKFFISAGEASGDLHGAELIRELRKELPDSKFVFLGGELMSEAACVEPVINYRNMAFMGFSEVLRNLGQISRNFKTAKKALLSAKPDCLILIDYPSFNLKLAKEAKRAGIPVYWYISPKVWAWKEYRVKSIRKLVKKVLCILPFEKDFYIKRGVDAVYVGNPSLEEMDRKLENCIDETSFRKSYGLSPQKPLLALVPGSRKGEIRNNLPIMVAVADRFPELEAVVAGAPGIDGEFYKNWSSCKVIYGQTPALMHFSTAALVTSGTATLECALAGTPQVACYRANGSRLSYNLMKRILKIPFVTLPNLIADKEVIPEMLVHLCTADSVSSKLASILPGEPAREKQLEGYREIREKLGEYGAAHRAANEIITDLKR